MKITEALRKLGLAFGMFLIPIAWMFFFSIGFEWLNGQVHPVIGIGSFAISLLLFILFFWVLWRK